MVCLHREQQQAAVQQHEALSGTKELEVSEAAWRCCHFAAVQQTHLHAAALELLCYLHWLLAASTPQILPVLLLLFLLVLLLLFLFPFQLCIVSAAPAACLLLDALSHSPHTAPEARL